ncbi:iron aquisition regulator (YbtA,AraC-like,required for transcription of FyuA/psn,Irp2) [Klebsiella michiganensis]|uniref:Iron aquisition regulator (YbtA,AraC-like,required for transcription of FyuA/psn,Irp2) n=1 Tax=Klebsiella michiganensis TaxID=1134687 RepID=A0A7H4MZC8_9ENTR|nr:iron aquisition regulator (YbtA,AraC-like,required for transcription of FyuA/psn,Irp2) [Klebsiella michiganensis]
MATGTKVWVMLSLVLDEHREDASCSSCHFNPMERQKLAAGKGSAAGRFDAGAGGSPKLARESGLSVLKIKRGFRVLFNNSVYGLFQAERMQEARRRLANGNTSVYDGGGGSRLCQRQPFLRRISEAVWRHPVDLQTSDLTRAYPRNSSVNKARIRHPGLVFLPTVNRNGHK